MTNDPAHRAAMLERLSALTDGELEDVSTAQACQQWRVDASLRSSWHAYHLIGDVLRSDDLGSAPARDAAFLAALRLRLADEPVVLAPPAGAAEPLATDRVPGRRRAWMAPTAVAAGFVVAVGTVFLTRAPDGAPSALARAGGGGLQEASLAGGGRGASVDARALVASGKLIRDVRLDRYLSAHKEFAGSSALGVPSGFLRNATAEAVDR